MTLLEGSAERFGIRYNVQPLMGSSPGAQKARQYGLQPIWRVPSTFDVFGCSSSIVWLERKSLEHIRKRHKKELRDDTDEDIFDLIKAVLHVGILTALEPSPFAQIIVIIIITTMIIKPALRAILAFYPRHSTIARLRLVERQLWKLKSSVGLSLCIDLEAAGSGSDQVITVVRAADRAELPASTSPSTPGRAFRMFPDPGAEFIWLDYTDPESVVDYVLKNYDLTVDTAKLRTSLKWTDAFAKAYDTWWERYNDSLMDRLNIGWDLDGFLLALALVSMEGVDTVRYDSYPKYGGDPST
ncbi:MAG: hypothetical protein M1826_007264 [Phylliscum demangeonii]|nr:MAG: hypothetical protein M1826_007264 [Phylliscum demangeonii]